MRRSAVLGQTSRPSNASARGYASSSSQSWNAQPVDLSYDLVESPKPSSGGQSLVICHGLLLVLLSFKASLC
jgi:hypothetical protein